MKKPIAGIIVAFVVGIFGLIWSGAVLFHTLYGTPSSTEAALSQTFPSLQIKTNLGQSLALMGYAVLIIGALMAYQNHPTGAKVVRVTSYFMIAVTIVLVVITFIVVTGAEAWPTLDAPTKGALIGGLVGGAIGAFLQWGLLLFLFRIRTSSGARENDTPPQLNRQTSDTPVGEKFTNTSDDKFYDEVAREMQEKSMVAGLWTKAYAEMGGDDAKARALYIKYRVAQLAEANRQRLEEERLSKKRSEEQKRAAKEEAERRERTMFHRIIHWIIGFITGLLTICFALCGVGLIVASFTEHSDDFAGEIIGGIVLLFIAFLCALATMHCSRETQW